MAITSPGLIDLSSNRTKPLNKLAMDFCKPNPTPIPIAPLNTVRAVKSIPTLETVAATAIMIKTSLLSLLNNTCTDGVKSDEVLICRSISLEIIAANQSRMIRESMPLITVNAETLKVPNSIARLSRTTVTGPSKFRMFNAAIVHAVIAINLDQILFLTKPVVNRMMIQASNKLTAIFITWLGKSTEVAISNGIESVKNQTTGNISGLYI